jgi:tetratricopeptide (TPR) repeat protein
VKVNLRSFSACPDLELLARFAGGGVPDLGLPALHAHLAECERCLQALVHVAKTSDEAAGSLAGHFAGKYQLGEVLGEGGMGVVYRARHAVSNSPAAVKMVRSLRANALASLRQETLTLTQIQHPQVVRILDHDLSCSDPWYAMELLEGETLADYLRRTWAPGRAGGARARSDQLSEILSLMIALCEPLAAVHNAGLVHCDLKPSNVFLRDFREPVLMDFGLTTRAHGAVGRELLDIGGIPKGTIPYLSPEVIRGQLPDARADLYAFGCILYEGITGSPPFFAESLGRILHMHLHEAPAPARSIVAGIPEELDRLLNRLLAKWPTDRFGHIEEVADALTQVRSGELPRAVAPITRLFRPQIIARDQPLEQALAACVQAQQARGGRLVAVEGESGIGKTFFANEVCRRGARSGMRVIVGECPAISALTTSNAGVSSTPLQPFRPFLEAVADWCRVHGEEQSQALLGWRLSVLAAYEPSLAQLQTRMRSEAPALPSMAARERLVQAMLDVLAILSAERPLLLALDDLQWADDLSVAVLQAVQGEFSESHPLVVLCLYRSDEVGTEFRAIMSGANTLHLRLQRLDAQAIAKLVADMLSVREPLPALVRFLHAHSEGIPFFVAEYLRAAVAERLLARNGGHWQLITPNDQPDQFPVLAMPTELAGLVRRRLSSLSALELLVLECAAILGRSFNVDVLREVLGLADTHEEVAPPVADLVRKDLIEGSDVDGYRFVHDKIREVVNASSSPERRLQLHGCAAAALERQDHARPLIEKRFGQLAFHFRLANQPRKAIDYLEMAAVRALALSANADAAQYIREAIDLDDGLSEKSPRMRRAQWQRMLGDSLQGLGRMNESIAPLSNAAALLDSPVPQGSLPMAGRLLLHSLRQAAHRLLPEQLLPRSTSAHLSTERVRVFDRLQRVYFFTAQDAPLLFATLSTLNHAEICEPSPELAVAYAHAAFVMSAMRMQSVASHYFQRSCSTLAICDETYSRTHVEMCLGLHRMLMGRLDEAAGYLDSAIAAAEAGGYFRGRDEALAIRAAVETFAGTAPNALQWLDSMAASAEKRHDKQLKCWSLLQKAQAWMMCNDLDGATPLIGEAVAMAPELGRPERIWVHSLQAFHGLLLDDMDTAKASATAALELIAASSSAQVYLLDSYSKVCEVHIALHARGVSGLALAEQACAKLEFAAGMYPVATTLAGFQRGALLWRQGKRERARAKWRLAYESAGSMSMRYEQARAASALAMTLPDGTEKHQMSEHAGLLSQQLQLQIAPHAMFGTLVRREPPARPHETEPDLLHVAE